MPGRVTRESGLIGSRFPRQR